MEEKLLRAVNCTIVTLLPKSCDAKTTKDLRPISCYTTFYKIISKILTDRLGLVIHDLVDESQSAFIPGWVIHDNIIMAQELVKGYGRQGISPRCTKSL